MRKYITKIFSSLAISALLVGIISPVALAATATTTTTPAATKTSGQALEIAPPLIYLSVKPGQTLTTQILIRDVSSTPLVVTGQANDFVAAGENGSPKVILDDTTSDPYSLKAWIAPLASVQLIPKEIKTLPVTIKVPANASPGGHYGVIRFTATAPSLDGSTSGVSLSASIGALMLLTVSGNITENLSVAEFSVNHDGKNASIFQSGPVGFVERLKNNGNVHEQPIGQVTITDMFGKKVAAVNVNLPPGNILPGSIRKFSQPLDKSVIGNKKLLGRYTAKLSVTYGNPKKTLNDTLTFWVIPFRTVAIIIAAIIIIFFALRFFIRRYNRRILEQAKNNKPPAPPTPPDHPHHPTHHQQ